MEKPNLWLVRLSKRDNPEPYIYLEDLAINHSIVLIDFYFSSIDVREMDISDIKALLRKIESSEISNHTIGKYVTSIERFMRIEKGDYIISPYYNRPNRFKVSIGHATGKLEILENLLSNNDLKFFAQNYRGGNEGIETIGKRLVHVVEWDSELFERNLLADEIKKQLNSGERITVKPFTFSEKLPYELAAGYVFSGQGIKNLKSSSNKYLENTKSKNLMVCLRKFKEIKEKITHNWIIAVATFILAIIAVLEYIS